MNFINKVLETIEKKNSLLCVGLDTAKDKIPPHLLQESDPIFEFNKQIIDATQNYAAAFKINLAFYEAYGIEGWQALKKTFDYLPSDVIKIADAKRGDIGNTAKMYAQALFDDLGADAITVNPLMGHDSAQPFLGDPSKGVFFLCLTSNPGSQDFQHFSNGEQKLYEKIAVSVNSWNSNNNCGLVVGATHPEELEKIRSLTPQLPFLIPGIGAQGGDLQKSVQFGTDLNGSNALYNSSRAIIYASLEKDFAQTAKAKAKQTRDDLNNAKI